MYQLVIASWLWLKSRHLLHCCQLLALLGWIETWTF
jgi:hypothetical protein